MSRLKRNLPYILALLPAAVLRVHDTLAFRWGYDGGAHVAYFRTLALFGRLPTMAENYLAWHEPLYYALAAAIWLPVRWFAEDAVATKAVALATCMLGFALIAGAGALTYRLSRSAAAAWTAAIVLAYLPIAIFVFEFPTNEALYEAGAALAILYLASRPLDCRRAAIAGAIVGALTLVKLTAFALLAAVLAWGALLAAEQAIRKRGGALRGLLPFALLAAIAIALAAPWQIYRETAFGNAFTTNNWEDAKAAKPEVLPKRFFVWFDPSVLADPFWATGKDSFWSMLYADSWNDYANLFLQIDRADAMPIAAKKLTDGGSWLPLWRDAAARAAIPFTVPLALAWAVGLVLAARLAIREREAHRPLALIWIFCLGTLASLAYNVYKYPFLERGTLKAAFGLAGIALSVALAAIGLASIPAIRKRPRLLPLALLPLLLVWLILEWPVLWV